MLALLKDESGATAIEYGLIAVLMCVGILTAWQFLTDGILGDATKVANALK